jgi:alkylhydroperoxidase family enzyme
MIRRQSCVSQRTPSSRALSATRTFRPRATAAAAIVDAVTREPSALSAATAQARAAGVDDDALAEVMYVVFMFNTINRIADALGFKHASTATGAAVLRRLGYAARSGRPP